MLTRDSYVLWLAFAGAIVGYLAVKPAPTEWAYADWIQAAMFILAWISGKLATSPLKGEPKDNVVNLNRIGAWLVLAAVISGMAVVGCGPKTKPVLVKTDQAIYQSVKAIHDTAVVLGQSGVLTPAQELKIQLALQPVVALGEQSTRVIIAWKSGPTPPELRRLVQELGALVTEIGKVIPDSPGKAQLLARVAEAQQAILIVLSLMGGV